MAEKGKRRLKFCMLIPIREAPNLPIYSGDEILAYISQSGHEVTWIIATDKDTSNKHLLPDNIKIFTVINKRLIPGNTPMLQATNRLLNLPVMFLYILKHVRNHNYDFILARQDIIYGLIALFIKMIYGIPFIFNRSNPLEQLLEICRTENRRPRFLWYCTGKLYIKVGFFLFRKADIILVISKWLKEQLIKQGIPEFKILAFPEGINTSLFFADIPKHSDRKYQINNSRIILYIGSLSQNRNLEILIIAFSLVKTKVNDVKLMMVGTGNDEAHLKHLSQEYGIEKDVIFTGQVSHKEVPLFINMSDICVSSIQPTQNYKLSSPIKILEYMAMAKPVIANEEIPDQKEILTESNAGILVNYTPDGFASAIQQLLDSPEYARKLGQHGPKWVKKNRSYEVLAKMIVDRCLEYVTSN